MMHCCYRAAYLSWSAGSKMRKKKKGTVQHISQVINSIPSFLETKRAPTLFSLFIFPRDGWSAGRICLPATARSIWRHVRRLQTVSKLRAQTRVYTSAQRKAGLFDADGK